MNTDDYIERTSCAMNYAIINNVPLVDAAAATKERFDNEPRMIKDNFDIGKALGLDDMMAETRRKFWYRRSVLYEFKQVRYPMAGLPLWDDGRLGAIVAGRVNK